MKPSLRPITTPDDEPEYHSPIGWSGWERHSSCHGSVALAALCPKAISSAAADLGTLAHRLARRWLLEGVCPEGVDREMRGHLWDYVREVWATFPRISIGALWVVEGRLSAPSIHEDCSGTVDALVWDAHEKVLGVHDLKYGKFPVDAKNNSQLMGYALCALETYTQIQPERIDFYIHQVRISPKPDKWFCDAIDLDIFRDEVVEHVAAIEAQKAILEKSKGDQSKLDLHAGDHCRYCPAWSVCQERILAAKREGIDLLIPKPEELPGDASTIVQFALKAAPWAAAVLKQAKDHMKKGGSIPGLKLVAGKRARVPVDPGSFEDELTTETDLGGLGLRLDQVRTKPEPKTKSVKQLEEVMTEAQKKAFASMWRYQEGAPVLVTESDKRPALKKANAEDYFKAIEDNSEEDEETE